MINLSQIIKQTIETIKYLNLRKVELLVLLVILVEFCFPHIAVAESLNNAPEPVEVIPTVLREVKLVDPDHPVTTPLSIVDQPVAESLPLATAKQPKKVIWVTVTAYSSTPDQTDSDPCTTANGFDVCKNNEENVIAANFLPFGTTVKMPDYFGDRTFAVQDRMNQRYTQRVDVWFKTREAAKEFGVQKLKVEIY